MAPKSRAEQVEPLEEFPLKGGGKYRFNLEGQSEVQCPNWPNCPSLDGVSADGWRQVAIPFGKKLNKYTGRCSPCQRSSRIGIDPINHPSKATVLRARHVRDPKDTDRTAYLCPECCPSYAEVHEWLTARGLSSGSDLSLDNLRRALEALGAECDEIHFVGLFDVYSGGKCKPWGGRCDRCRDRARFNWVNLRDGGWARRDFENETEGYFICPDCGEHRTAVMPSGKNLERATGRCKPCADRRRRTIKGVAAHASGAICLKSVRDPERTRDRAAYICASWAGKPIAERPADCLGVDFGWLNQFDDEGWRGHCENCARRFDNHPRVKTKDVPVYGWAATQGPDGPFVELRAWIRYSKGGEKEVPVWFIGCGCEYPLKRDYIATLKSAHKNEKAEFSRWCPLCVKSPSRLAATLQAQFQNGNELKSGGAEKKRPGPEKGFNAKITEEKIREAFNTLGRYAPQEKVAEVIGVDARSLRDWHRARGLSYKQFQQQFTATGGS